MRKSTKLVVALCMSVIMIFESFTVSQASTAHSRDEAVSWANSQIGQSLDYDGVYGAQCVDLIKYYYAYFGCANYAMGNACAYATNNLPSGWQRVYGDYQPGDIAVWKTNHSCSTCSTDGYGHVGIITSADSVGFNAVNQNYCGTSHCTQNWFYVSALQCAIRPNFANSIITPTVSVTFQDQNINNIWDTNAEFYVKIMNPNKSNCEQVGCNLYDSNNNLIKTYTEACNLSTSYINYNCNINNDMQFTLTPGTEYKYELFAVVGGQVYKDSVRDFTTTGTSDVEKPVISDVSVSEFDGYGYEITCKATDNEKVNRVQFPTWTEKNGNNDLVSDWGDNEKVKGTLKEDGYYHYRVNIADYNKEVGNYHTHIYVYDEAGNWDAVAVPAVTIPKYTLKYVDFSGFFAAQGKDASIISVRLMPIENKDMTFSSVRFVTQVNKNGKIIGYEKEYGDITVEAGKAHYFEYVIDRADFDNADGIYTTTCYFVDPDGKEQTFKVDMDFSDYKDNYYAKVEEGEIVDLEEISGISKGGYKYNLITSLQPDISEYLTVAEEEITNIGVETTKFLCKKQGRVYVLWISLSSGAERKLQIVDIVPKESEQSTLAPVVTITPLPSVVPTSKVTVSPTQTINITAVPEVDEQVTPTIKVTTTPEATEEATPTMKVTATPEATEEATPTVKVTATPEATEEATPTVKVTTTPEAIVRPTATITVTPKPTNQPEKTTVKKPSKVSLKSVKALGQKKIKVTWKWQAYPDGYQVQYALNKTFSKSCKTKNLSFVYEKVTLSKLKSKKYYYVRVRAYKKVDGEKIYGKWSTVKKCKVK